MKEYGFKLSDGKVTYTKWFSTDGETDGIPDKNGKLHCIIKTQDNLVFHHAYAYSEIVAREHGLQFTSLTEQDYKKLGNPVKRFFKQIFKK